MPKIHMRLPSAGAAEVQRQRARQRRLAQMENWVDVPEKGTKWIPLGKGKAAIVDEEDYHHLMQWNWHVSAFGYAVRFIGPRGKSKVVWMHREILGTPPGIQTDHANQNRLDNRKQNLRQCTATQNQGNRWKSQHAKTSKFKGVYWSKHQNRFAAYGRQGSKNRRLGSFQSEVEAAKAYNRWARSYFGKFAQLNPV
jgi:hypothetical protein